MTEERKQMKKFCCQVPAEGLYCEYDSWPWRKYAMKSTPYPKAYYKCGTKGCLARKKVELSSSDMGMFDITYIGDHNHRPPTINRHITPSSVTAGDPSKPPDDDKMDGEDEDDEISESDRANTDDFFERLVNLSIDRVTGGGFPVKFMLPDFDLE